MGVTITQKISAVVRTLIDALRTLLVWFVGLLVWYYVEEPRMRPDPLNPDAVLTPKYGEKWDSRSSPVKLAGFALCVTGTLMYKEIVRCPCFRYAVDGGNGK